MRKRDFYKYKQQSQSKVAHQCLLISAFIIFCLDGIIPLAIVSEILRPRIELTFVANQASF